MQRRLDIRPTTFIYVLFVIGSFRAHRVRTRNDLAVAAEQRDRLKVAGTPLFFLKNLSGQYLPC